MATEASQIRRSSMDSSFPVLLPEEPALFLADLEFERHVHAVLSNSLKDDAAMTGNAASFAEMDIQSTTSDDFTLLVDPVDAAVTSSERATAAEQQAVTDFTQRTSDSKFMDALFASKKDVGIDHEAIGGEGTSENKMLTENLGLAYRSTKSALLDLFSELEKTVSGPRLRELLEAAWKEDPLAALKIVWNARSIHLGKGEKESFYRCLGWIHREHPETVVTNLKWIFRSVIEKKVKKEDEDAAVMVEKSNVSTGDVTEESKSMDKDFEVLHGVSHGYWKDLLNILTLAVNDKFDVLEDPTDVLNKENDQAMNKPKLVAQLRASRRKVSRAGLVTHQPKEVKTEKSRHKRIKEAVEHNAEHKQVARERKHELESSRHANALRKLKEPFYRAVHLTVARLFAEQLRKDTDLLKSGKKKDLNDISLAAKWAPSLESFHDKHTFIASSIAEVLYPRSAIGEPDDTRELYLKRAREWYRRFALSPLRKALQVVERDVTAGTFGNIEYARVPSIAMDNYKGLFARKDIDRFETYLENVAQGKSRISGAVLMPATLVGQARGTARLHVRRDSMGRVAAELLAEKMAEIQGKVLEGQWNSLVQRIRDNGKLEPSIAVCDVSGSMEDPTFRDRTCPMDTAIGLSLLMAEITEPPFGGAFISFSAQPEVLRVGGKGDTRSFTEKVHYIMDSEWGYNTDFIAVFERLILPLAVENKLKQNEMVKQVFVFSDMQFDAAQPSSYERVNRWETSFERVKRKFAEAGYELPKLIFWNLAGGRAGYTGVRDPVAPKPVEKEVQGTALVSGYSQAMMKVFLEEGQFGEEEEGEEVDDEEMEEEDGDGVVEVKKKVKGKVDPMAVVWKAIGHRAYEMLRVVD